MMYTHRSGLVEQVKFLRTETPSMKLAQFDFEEREAAFRASRLDKIIFWLAVVGLVALYAHWYA